MFQHPKASNMSKTVATTSREESFKVSIFPPFLSHQISHLNIEYCTNIWVFPKIGVPPNHPILIGFSIIFTIHFGVSLFLETPPILMRHRNLHPSDYRKNTDLLATFPAQVVYDNNGHIHRHKKTSEERGSRLVVSCMA